jgi:hypothetical protein
MRELNTNELLEYIKKNGITLATTTENFQAIPKGTKLYFGLSRSYVTTVDTITEFKNKTFNYPFEYMWTDYWHTEYKGKFSLGKVVFKKPTHIVIWEEDRDPAKFFSNEKDAKEFIKQLSEKQNVKKNSIVLVEIKSVKKVNVLKRLTFSDYKI